MPDFMSIAATPWMHVQQVVFYLLATIMVIAAIGVVTLRNIFHSALSLAVVAIGAACIYLMLNAEFLAVVQILVYVGAVVTLIAFVVMLTARVSGMKQSNEQKFISFVITIVLLLVLVFKLIDPNVTWRTAPETDKLADIHTIGNALLTTYIFPFEAISIVLLIALIGAIVLARREEKNK